MNTNENQLAPGPRTVTGVITRVNGPIVEASGMREAAMLEVVEVGEHKLVGEIIRLRGDTATIQVYENTGGVKPGSPVRALGTPLSVRLGPGLLGAIYDGIQRPLAEIAAHSGYTIRRGEKPAPLDGARKWRFVPACRVGDTLVPGAIYGRVQETQSIEHRLLVPPEAGGRVLAIEPEGDHIISDPVCRIATPGGGERVLTLCVEWPVRLPRPVDRRIAMLQPLVTGLRVIDTFFPIAKGGTAAIPGGFGTGKTMTQHALAKWSSADIIVYVGCGERGNEMTEVLREFPELIDPRTGRSLMERTILIANTSNMPVAAREASIYTGITLAEYYRDMGYDVALMADSTSRWAEALRELSGRLEEMPADEGYPAYLPTRLAEFYERAGKVKTLGGGEGSVSVIGAVSPPGGDFSEPVTQHTSRFIRCFWALDRDLANARHYPAISWLDSYSEYTADIAPTWLAQDSHWQAWRDGLMTLLQQEVKLQRIVKLVGPDALPDHQRLILFLAEVIKNGFLQQNSFDAVDMYCSPEKQMRMLRVLVLFRDRCHEAIQGGSALAAFRHLPCVEQLIRMKSAIPNHALDQFDRLEEQVGKEFDDQKRRLAP